MMTPTASTERYYVKGEIVEVSNPAYGEMTIKDSTGELLVYGTYGADGEDRYPALEEKPVAGDYVLLYGNIQMYGDTPEIKSGWIIDFKSNAAPFDPSQYEEMTLSEARAAEDGTLIRTEGIVSAITNASGVVPNGVLLTDSETSMYVYDDALANSVKVGNKIDICATKDYFVLDTESSYAEKWGYKGSNQLANVHLMENDKGENKIDLSWADEITVKNLVETPANEDITGLVYKSTAVIHKDVKPGYTNYYINDLDNSTGSYVYTQANGADFGWLDQYDGKICSVYYTALNAKSTSTGTVWRFLPVQVEEDTDFAFDQDDAAQFVLDYYATSQFAAVYQADPEMEVLTAAPANDLIDLTGVSLSYSSSDNNVVWFTEEGGKTYFHVDASETKTATVTITASNGTHKGATATVTITAQAKPEFENLLTVKQAIDSAVGTEVVVDGIVGPSLVNKVGFYLIDESGAIAVQVETEDEMAGLAIGQTVTLSGIRDLKADEGVGGQINIRNATIEYNEFGNKPYPTDSFITGKTIADVLALDTDENIHTTEVYVIEDVTVTEEAAQYYHNYYLTQGEDDLRLYCSNGQSQYGWVADYIGETIDVEIAPCQWNTRTPYACCILSVTDSEGNTVYNELNFD